jgi:hypothetical protein
MDTERVRRCELAHSPNLINGLLLRLIETTARADTSSESRSQHVDTVKRIFFKFFFIALEVLLFTLARYVRMTSFSGYLFLLYNNVRRTVHSNSTRMYILLL